MAEEEQLTKEIDALQEKIVDLKKKRSRCSKYPPIKLSKELTNINLKTNNGSDWTFSEIRYEDNIDRHVAMIECEACFNYKVEAHIKIDKTNMEIVYFSVEGNDKFFWDEKQEGYMRCFYDGRYDTDRVVLMKFEKI
jgi:hypothetical protein